MDVLKLQYPPGTIIKCSQTNDRLRIEYYSDNKMYLSSVLQEDAYGSYWDYFTQLGKKYTKDKTAQVLYGRR